ncbi:MAG: eL32 family ribosomal protein [Candidatus Paceibacteria bacterium]
MVKKKSKPKFNVLNAGFKKRVKDRWRKPRGIDNKKRVRFAWAGASPRIGYKNASEIRGMHPSGKFEVLVHNVAELKAVQGLLTKPGTQTSP